MTENKQEEINTNVEEPKEKKLGFFKKLGYSITKFEKYPEMAAEGVARAFKYLIQLMLIFSVIVGCAFVYQFYSLINKGADYVQNELPNITYSNGILNVESNQAIIIDDINYVLNKIIIDTNTESQTQIDEYVNSIPQDNAGAVILKDKIIIKNTATANSTIYSYTDLLSSITNQNFDNLTKQDILNYVKGSGMISLYAMFFALMFVYVFVIYLVSVLVDTVVLGILGNITILFTKLKLKFSAVYSMAIYALTLSVILNAIYITVNMITGFEIKYFQIMYTCIAYVYLVAAIFIIRADFIKKQGELMKILEEQEKIRQQMKEQEKKEQEEQEKQNENKKPEKEEKSGDKETSEDDSEPKGSEA